MSQSSNIITALKNTLQGFSSRADAAEERRNYPSRLVLTLQEFQKKRIEKWAGNLT